MVEAVVLARARQAALRAVVAAEPELLLVQLPPATEAPAAQAGAVVPAELPEVEVVVGLTLQAAVVVSTVAPGASPLVEMADLAVVVVLLAGLLVVTVASAAAVVAGDCWELVGPAALAVAAQAREVEAGSVAATVARVQEVRLSGEEALD